MPSDPTTAYLGVGSNIAPHENIPRALDALRAHVTVTGTSAFYVTAPLDRPKQDDYVNGVWRIETETLPRTLKRDVLRAVERDLGRVRSDDPYGPRTIDLDLLLYGDRVMSIPELTLPDPDIRTRPFVAVPLLELAPDLVLPGSGTPLAGVVRTMDREGLREDAELTARLRMMVPPTGSGGERPAPPPPREERAEARTREPESRKEPGSRRALWAREYEQRRGIRLDYTDELPPSVSLFLQFLGPGGGQEEYNRVLDIGCGKGRVGLHLARVGFHVTGFDIVDSAVQAFAREAWQRGLGERVSVHAHDAGAPWPVADAGADCAFAVTILDNLTTPDEQRHFRSELRRVLRPGGLAVVRSYLPEDGYYGPLLRASPRREEGILTDPNNDLAFRIYTQQELRAFPGEGFRLRQERLWPSQSFKYGLLYQRLSAILIFERV